MRMLIGLVFVVIVATGTYYLWGEMSAHQDGVRRADATRTAEAELYSLAKAGPGDRAKVTRWCGDVDDRVGSDLAGNKAAGLIVQNCRSLGYL